MVHKGVALNIRNTIGPTEVAVKQCNADASPQDKLEFMEEATIMKGFKHTNIIRLLARRLCNAVTIPTLAPTSSVFLHATFAIQQ